MNARIDAILVIDSSVGTKRWPTLGLAYHVMSAREIAYNPDLIAPYAMVIAHRSAMSEAERVAICSRCVTCQTPILIVDAAGVAAEQIDHSGFVCHSAVRFPTAATLHPLRERLQVLLSDLKASADYSARVMSWRRFQADKRALLEAIVLAGERSATANEVPDDTLYDFVAKCLQLAPFCAETVESMTGAPDMAGRAAVVEAAYKCAAEILHIERVAVEFRPSPEVRIRILACASWPHSEAISLALRREADVESATVSVQDLNRMGEGSPFEDFDVVIVVLNGGEAEIADEAVWVTYAIRESRSFDGVIVLLASSNRTAAIIRALPFTAGVKFGDLMGHLVLARPVLSSELQAGVLTTTAAPRRWWDAVNATSLIVEIRTAINSGRDFSVRETARYLNEVPWRRYLLDPHSDMHFIHEVLHEIEKKSADDSVANCVLKQIIDRTVWSTGGS